MKTYRAYYEDSRAEIYAGRPNGNLFGELPLGARPAPRGESGTLEREDGGDPFEAARFVTPSGRPIVIHLEFEPLAPDEQTALRESLRRNAEAGEPLRMSPRDTRYLATPEADDGMGRPAPANAAGPWTH